ncbi:antA/AntB antirepressor family protein [Chromobacterium sp. ASV23]|uniref:antA/AntB antirepressor family protein n=1 Tax=Chromobacterium sp. ASV23 TaxID=2795110 RepID=UPI0018ED76B3|nr:antA/AntB antirepressor family protein [Chromobacterium sp. ASV23]
MNTQTTTIKKATKTKRTGKSLIHTVNNCPGSVMDQLGITTEQAERMMNLRRVFPLDIESRTEPNYDARKIWERIGKPYGRFRKWAEQYIKPLQQCERRKAQICAILTPTKTKPRQDYRLSRDVAMHLAMQANTNEGENIRQYFLDMEDLATKLMVNRYQRVNLIAEADKALTHAAMVRHGERAKAGEIGRSAVQYLANVDVQDIASMIAEVLSGFRAGAWREVTGKGIRDILSADDLDEYARLYNVAEAIYAAGQDLDQIKEVLSKACKRRVDPWQYLEAEQLAEIEKAHQARTAAKMEEEAVEEDW